MQIQLPYSTHQAQAILAAWQSGNVQTLGEELDRVSRIPVESSDSMEEERMELLSAIASEWRLSRQPFGSDSQIYCGLLQHLGFAGDPAKPYRTNLLPSAFPKVERRLAAVPQRQKRACCGDR